jgi:hypothetical protein
MMMTTTLKDRRMIVLLKLVGTATKYSLQLYTIRLLEKMMIRIEGF